MTLPYRKQLRNMNWRVKMAKQKQDNKTVDIELLILRDKIECLISDYEDSLPVCLEKYDKHWCETIIKDLKKLMEN